MNWKSQINEKELVGIIMFAIDADWYDLGKFQFTLHAMEGYWKVFIFHQQYNWKEYLEHHHLKILKVKQDLVCETEG